MRFNLFKLGEDLLMLNDKIKNFLLKIANSIVFSIILLSFFGIQSHPFFKLYVFPLVVAAIASFFIPGLGQIYNGQILKGILFIIMCGIPYVLVPNPDVP